MNTSNNQSLLIKLGFNLIKGIRFSILNSTSKDVWFNYDHTFKYNPDGRAGSYKETSYNALQLNHMITPKLFYELKMSYLNNYTGSYLYKDPLDTNYVHGRYLENFGPGFFTGGQQKNHSMLTMLDKTIKFEIYKLAAFIIMIIFIKIRRNI